MDEREYIEEYVKELEGIVPLSEEENQRLYKELQNGKDVSERLIEGNLYLVTGRVVDVLDCGIPAGDLIQEGNVALINAIGEAAALNAEETFVDYLEEKIDAALENFIAAESKESLAAAKLEEEANRLLEITKEFEEENERPATLKELAELMKMSEDEVERVLRISYSAMTMGETSSDSDTNKNPLTDGWG